MTDGDTRSTDWESDLPPATRRAISLARLALGWERLWPRLALALSMVGVFLTLAWLGVFTALPDWPRLGTACLLAAATVAGFVRVLRTPWPSRRAAADRLERQGGLPHRPLTAITDRPATPPMADGDALWQAHRRRLYTDIGRLSVRPPSPRLDRADPYALRAIVFLAVIVGFVATSDHRTTIVAAFRPPTMTAADLRVDVWATPPAWTGEAPRALVSLASAQPADEPPAADIPAGSLLSIRLAGIAAPVVTYAATDQPAAALVAHVTAPDQAAFETSATTSGTLTLSGRGLPTVALPITVRTDTPPTIRFVNTPSATAKGALRLDYAVADDYRVASAAAHLDLVAPGDARPLVALPDIALALPRRGSDRAATTRDVTAHPLAGAAVLVTLEARDDAGHAAETPPLAVTLPARPVRSPLAAAILEQRRLLAADGRRAKEVAATFDTLGRLGAPFITKTGQVIGLSAARTRIAMARDDDDLRSVLDYLWQMALAIDAGDLSPVEDRLAAAREALRQALETGASPAEIARLSEELKSALDAYLQAMMAAAARDPGRLNDLGRNQAGQTVSRDDLDKLIDRMQQLSEMGRRDVASELLSQLDDILSGLSLAPSGASAPPDPTLDQLADIIRRQQELMNRTHKLTPDGYTGEEFGDDSGDRQALDDLAKDQSALARRFSDLLGRLPGDQAKGKDGKPSQLGDAGQAMQDAEGNLGRGDAETAIGDQGAALDALRRGARDLARGAGGPKAAGTDPLGRPTGRTGPDFGDNTKVPGEIEVQRARRLLDELRRRYADPNRPALELDYLRRLITPF